MKLTLSEIERRLADDFSGPLLFQPLSFTGADKNAARPIALLATVAQMIPHQNIPGGEAHPLSLLLDETARQQRQQHRQNAKGQEKSA